MAETLKGRVALVTGARNIGRSICTEFAKEGAKVAVVSRGQQSIDETLADIEAVGGTAIGIRCDIGIKSEVEEAVVQTVKAFGKLDILVNNAQSFGTTEEPSHTPVRTPLEDFRDGEWEQTFQTGPTATYWFMKAAFPYLKVSGAGRIINFGSHYGQIGNEQTVAYNSAKEAIRGLSRTAAREWGKYNITVNVINPAAKVDRLQAMLDSNSEWATEIVKNIPLGRFGEIIETARVAVFIAGPDASYLTGMTFMVDGGLCMYP